MNNNTNDNNMATTAAAPHPEKVVEEILVLFGSQTGNSEQAAETLSKAIPKQISIPSVLVTSTYMQLDDFLELHNAQWTSIVVIITSSYGVGQAPLGCYKFRKLCDHILSNETNTNHSSSAATMLDGITFAMLGLGDSKYTTFFQNPTKIHSALCTAGALPIGPFGIADASSVDQSKQITDWIETIIPILTETLKEKVVVEKQQQQQKEKLKLAQENTIRMCQQVISDYHRPSSSVSSKLVKEQKDFVSVWQYAILVMLVAILIMILYS